MVGAEETFGFGDLVAADAVRVWSKPRVPWTRAERLPSRPPSQLKGRRQSDKPGSRAVTGLAVHRPKIVRFGSSGEPCPQRSFFSSNCSPANARFTNAPQNGVGV